MHQLQRIQKIQISQKESSHNNINFCYLTILNLSNSFQIEKGAHSNMTSQISLALLWSFLSGPHPLQLFVGIPHLSELVILLLLLLRASVGRQLLYVDENIWEAVARAPGGCVCCQLACFRLWNHDFLPTWELNPGCF